MHTIKRRTKLLLYDSREVGLEIKAEKMNCMFTSCRQSADLSFERVAKFRYFGMVAINQIDVYEGMKIR
jgi:hypothetical protein